MKDTLKDFRPLYLHSSSLVGGGNKVLLRLIEGLQERGGRPLSVIPTKGPMEEELRRRDVPYAVMDFRPSTRSNAKYLLNLVYFMGLVLRWHTQILHTNDPFLYQAIARFVRFLGRPLVCYIHHPGVTTQLVNWALQIPPCLITTPSYFMKRHIQEAYGDFVTPRIECIWNPIDVEWFRPSFDLTELERPTEMRGDASHVTIIGALAPHKGHSCFLRMAKMILETGQDVFFHVIGSSATGDKTYASSLRKLAVDLEISDRVHFWGYIDDKKVREILVWSDLFVLPSHEEGFGLVVAEAQACALPVLTSSIPPLDEVVVDGRTGYLLDPEDYGAFAECASALLRDRGARKRMGAEGRNWVVERFSSRIYIEKMVKFYQEVIEG